MTKQDQIKALAELDGWRQNVDEAPSSWKETWSSPDSEFKTFYRFSELPGYLTSYDAIIPLVRKHKMEYLMFIFDGEDLDKPAVLATRSQLCEALLRATGKWKK